MKPLSDIGLIGLAVMGENLVLNMAGKEFQVSVFNRTNSRMHEFLDRIPIGLPVMGTISQAQFIDSLQKPRIVMLMVKAGQPVDDMIDQLMPLLDPGDILIDGGNSFFEDTRRRYRKLAQLQIGFVGMGVSGGEEGALNGPSLMPGGDEETYRKIAPIFNRIAAQVDDEPCCAYVGSDGAGHYVKMVHNGIEYSDMQLISEAYYILKQIGGLSAAELSNVFEGWNKGPLNSYLIEITRDILAFRDSETGLPLVDMILDRAGQKGTGKWTSQSALDLGVPIPAITEAVFFRYMSALKSERVMASTLLKGPERNWQGNRQDLINAVHDALYASKVCSYAQGFSLLKAAAVEYGWNLNMGQIALLWRGGCIIRAQFLDRIRDAFAENEKLPNLMLAPFFTKVLVDAQKPWRWLLQVCRSQGIPAPAFNASLDYYDSYRSAQLPANLIQAQRDYFGAHTFERIDRSGNYHVSWSPVKTEN